MTNVIGALFYQGWYEDRSADGTLEFAFGRCCETECERVVREIDASLPALPSSGDVEAFFLSFTVDMDFRREFDGDVRAWLEAARSVVMGFTR